MRKNVGKGRRTGGRRRGEGGGVDGWMDGWMDEWIDGRIKRKEEKAGWTMGYHKIRILSTHKK